MIGGGVVRVPAAEGFVELALVAPEDRDIGIAVGPSLAAYPEVERPSLCDPPGRVEAAHYLQQAGWIEVLPFPAACVVVPDHRPIEGGRRWIVNDRPTPLSWPRTHVRDTDFFRGTARAQG